MGKAFRMPLVPCYVAHSHCRHLLSIPSATNLFESPTAPPTTTALVKDLMLLQLIVVVPLLVWPPLPPPARRPTVPSISLDCLTPSCLGLALSSGVPSVALALIPGRAQVRLSVCVHMTLSSPPLRCISHSTVTVLDHSLGCEHP